MILSQRLAEKTTLVVVPLSPENPRLDAKGLQNRRSDRKKLRQEFERRAGYSFRLFPAGPAYPGTLKLRKITLADPPFII